MNEKELAALDAECAKFTFERSNQLIDINPNMSKEDITIQCMMEWIEHLMNTGRSELIEPDLQDTIRIWRAESLSKGNYDN